jgi:hypothetical protein
MCSYEALVDLAAAPGRADVHRSRGPEHAVHVDGLVVTRLVLEEVERVDLESGDDDAQVLRGPLKCELATVCRAAGERDAHTCTRSSSRIHARPFSLNE